MREFPTLTERQISVKVKKITEKGLIALLYKTSRVDMDLLDKVYGAENWQVDYKEIKGNLYCGIGIRTPESDPDTWDAWIWKWNCGIESREDGEGNEKKGEASDAFKRAGFCIGIGRELYTSPFIWIPADKCKIEKRGERFICNDKFEVEKIAYDEDRNISGLAIRNITQKGRAFIWQAEK